MSSTNILLWSVLPYIAISSFIIGLVWRFKYDKFNWTTRSSQIYEGKLLNKKTRRVYTAGFFI